ncbi:MAG: hypothetical protein WAK01_10200 [Methylocystis sp.]
MTDAIENDRLDQRWNLLSQELEVVKAALERHAKDASCDGRDWSLKLLQWRDEIEVSLREMPERAA